MYKKSQAFLIIVIILITIYGSFTKNSLVIGTSAVVIALGGLIVQPKTWQNITSSVLFALVGIGYIYKIEILQAMIIPSIFISIFWFRNSLK